MVHHFVFWNFAPVLSEEEKKEAGEQIVRKLESLRDQIPGILSLEVQRNDCPGSNRDIALISRFVSREALEQYQVHPIHVEASGYVKSVTCDRACFDYEE